jgi:hypothetical protein
MAGTDPVPAASGILDPNNLSFASFVGGATPGSLDEIKRRRAIAQALASQKRGFPKNIGEGLTSLGEAVGDRLADNKLTAAETAYTTKQAADPLFSTAGPVGAPTPAVAPVPAPMRPPAPVPGVPTVPGPRTDAEDPILQRQKIAALLQGGTAQGVPSENPTEAGVAPPQTGSPASDDSGLWAARQGAIGGIESGGAKDPYRTVGVPTKYGRALGRYGIVEANVGPWSAAALGKPLTPEQFLADPAAQDAVFKHRFGSYVAKFGEEGAARAWYGGPGNIAKTNLMDDHGRLTIGGYGQDYLRRLQGAARAATAGAPEGGGDAGTTMTIDSATGVEPENPPTPTSIRPMTATAGGTVGPAPATIPAASVPEGEYLLPKPEPPATPVRTPEHPQETAARRALSAMSADPDNPQRRILANMVKEHEDRRAFNDAREITRYNKEMESYNAKVAARDAQLVGLEKTRDETRKRRFEQTQAETTAATEARLGGRKVEEFVKDFKGEHGEARKQVVALDGINEAEAAIKAGAHVGIGRGFGLNIDRVRAALGSEAADKIAAQSQILDATLKSTLAIAIAKIQAGDPKVTNNDLLVAQGMTGTPEMQRAAILKLTSIAKQEARDNINTFEERRHQKLGGTPLESDFPLTVRPTTSPEKLKILLDHKDDANTRAHFDKTFGPGAAQLEIDRARRAEEAARRKK